MSAPQSIEAAWESVDPLGEALHSLRMSGTFYVRSELTAPWGMELPAMPGCLNCGSVARRFRTVLIPNPATFGGLIGIVNGLMRERIDATS